MGYRESPMDEELSHSTSSESKCVVRYTEILGPYFVNVDLTSARYFLWGDLISKLINLYPNEERDLPRNYIFFQQDDAPLHYTAPVCTY